MPTTETIWRVHYFRTFFTPHMFIECIGTLSQTLCTSASSRLSIFTSPGNERFMREDAGRKLCKQMPVRRSHPPTLYERRVHTTSFNILCILRAVHIAQDCCNCVCVCTKVSWAVIKIRKMENFPQCLCYKVHFTIRLLPANQPHSHIHLNVACCVITLF